MPASATMHIKRPCKQCHVLLHVTIASWFPRNRSVAARPSLGACVEGVVWGRDYVPSRKRERAVQSRTDMHVRARRCTEVYRVSSRRPADCVLQWLWPGWTSHGVYACDTGQEGVQRNYKQWRGICVTFQCNTFKLYVPHAQAKKATIKVEILDESDVTHLRGTVIGPPDTPFEGELVQCVCVCVWFSEPGIYTMF